MNQEYDNKASDTYPRPKDRFYEFMEQHAVSDKIRRQQERKGTALLLFLCSVLGLTVLMHEEVEFILSSTIFGI